MDLTALRAFVAVADDGSFSAAAERLHLSQPAVSKRVRQLENELGQRLFDRIARRVQLTEAGRALLPGARRILLEVEESRRRLAQLSGRVSGRLSLGSSHHIGLHRLPALLRSYTRRYPEVDLDLRFLDSEAGCREVESGTLELALVTLPQTPPEPLLATRVWDDPLAIVVSAEHPLVHEAPSDAAALTAWPAILPAVGTFTRELIDHALRARGLRPNVRLETNYLETIRSMVSIGLGWSVLPLTLLDSSVHRIDVPGFALSRRLGFVHHRRRTLSNAAQALIRTALGAEDHGSVI